MPGNEAAPIAATTIQYTMFTTVLYDAESTLSGAAFAAEADIIATDTDVSIVFVAIATFASFFFALLMIFSFHTKNLLKNFKYKKERSVNITVRSFFHRL